MDKAISRKSTGSRIAGVFILALIPWPAGCGTGTLGDAPACQDICAENATCLIPDDPATCTCDPGYQGDGYTCADMDECAAGNPCGVGACENLAGAYTCACPADYTFDGITCNASAVAITGAGTQGSPRAWADGTLAASCLDYLMPSPPYVYQGSTGDGMYTLDVTGQPVDVYCDMTTDGGGFTRVLFWNREAQPESHTLASLQALLIDELVGAGNPNISPMGDITELADRVRWSDFDSSYDALSYRRDVNVPNNGELLFDIHYDGLSMESSGIWFYATAAGTAQDILCWSTAENNANYTADEQALVPYACGADTTVVTFTWDTIDALEQRALDGEITSLHIRSLHADVDLGDSSHLYRLGFYVR